ncbi:MAG: type II secretion system protein GspN [Deltaproteobacteria bacterium]|nr:type II secretion system protein GspN [Deltaproteobacteria bacterium]
MYVLYGVALTAFLLYFCFPSDALNEYIQSRANNLNTSLYFSVERAKPWLPIGLRLWGTEVSTKNRPRVKLFKADSTLIRPDLWSFLRGEGRYRFKSLAYGGDIKGFVFIEEDGFPENFDTRIEFENIKVGAHKYLKELLGRQIDGTLGGYVNYKGSDKGIMDGAGETSLQLSEGRLELALPFLSMESVDFEDVIIDMYLKDRRVDFKRFELKGSLFTATISGSLRLSNNLLRSAIDLKGTIELFSEFFKNNTGLEVMGLLRSRMNKGKISFAVYGTLEAPKYKII